jgi:hypothetical protein
MRGTNLVAEVLTLVSPVVGRNLTKLKPGFAPERQTAIQLKQSDARCWCRERNDAMPVKCLFNAVERRGDIRRRVAAFVLPISDGPGVTSCCAGKLGLREPSEHTSGANLPSRDNIAHNRTVYDSIAAMKRSPYRSRFYFS